MYFSFNRLDVAISVYLIVCSMGHSGLISKSNKNISERVRKKKKKKEITSFLQQQPTLRGLRFILSSSSSPFPIFLLHYALFIRSLDIIQLKKGFYFGSVLFFFLPWILLREDGLKLTPMAAGLRSLSKVS